MLQHICKASRVALFPQESYAVASTKYKGDAHKRTVVKINRKHEHNRTVLDQSVQKLLVGFNRLYVAPVIMLPIRTFQSEEFPELSVCLLAYKLMALTVALTMCNRIDVRRSSAL